MRVPASGPNSQHGNGLPPPVDAASVGAATLRPYAEALAARLPPLLLAAERVAATVAQGVHGRRRVGPGDSFWQFRPYESGDAGNRIDWRQSARARTLYVREREWAAVQSAWLWCDGSPSMCWRSHPDLPEKQARAQLLLLALAALLLRGGEHVAWLGSGEPARGGTTALEHLAVRLLTTPARAAPSSSSLSSSTPANDGLPPTTSSLPRHSQLVLFSDTLVPLPALQTRLTALAGTGVRGHLLQVLDPAEEALPYHGRVLFTGLETGESEVLIPRTESVQDAYRTRLEAHRTAVQAITRRLGWSFSVHHTDQPPHHALLGLYGQLAGGRFIDQEAIDG